MRALHTFLPTLRRYKIMAQFHFNNDDLEYVVDDYYDAADFYDDPFGDVETPRSNNFESLDSDLEDDFETSKPKTDTSALEVKNGKDIQGIPWERLNFTRDKYRETRLKQYKNYENLSRSRDDLQKVPDLPKDCLEVEKGQTFYDFQFNTRLVKSTIVHFQVQTFGHISEEFGFWPCQHDLQTSDTIYLLHNSISQEFQVNSVINVLVAFVVFLAQLRNLLCATSKHDVYLMQNYSAMHWSSLLRRGKEVLNVAKPIVPSLKRPGLLAQSLNRVQISTMVVKENLMVAGGFQGELVCKYLNQPGVAFCTKLTTDENAITNAVDVYHNPSGSMRAVTANNDAQVRIFDAENFGCLNRFSYDWSVNNTSVSPDGKLLAILGDSTECLIAEAQSGKVVGNLKGHLDYSFASAWHPDGRILATGNQDTTCRLWDIRNLSQSLSVLKGNMGAIRALKFTSDGRFLAMAEPADFVHIFNTESGYVKCQEIDLFGEIAGISFSPDTEALFVGVADRTYGSLLEFNRRHYNRYMYSIF
ncbi:hypothetical protein JRO89_XS07G0147200 [Xanthoceras sorbifolium]|uniref:Transducin/WD40 repeat-like superfamily protein n=1 Tax=Xanthoceras sorbifolium TaxID=99658 RepID=A0ABQ8HU06_9ROSI|nr:hypothetical protein JRO89_XS07G0147200 [Xanthoceras sorbifolium]